ncbi:protein kinase [Neiella marina]|uniref:Protein kinase n=1 Tax=Neiella holothuriorum TaxID=2870530 RepID=A0ABS7EEJ2_9GAMM|nr:protein kinase [Neiella holothuriorum]MBW8190655.1 protein kinase [Neiella holothuriorum]
MPSTALEGITTDTGWVIGSMIDKRAGSGGNFCVQYTAQSPSGEIGFLKAMDLTRAMSSGNLEAIGKTINEYVFEQNILKECKGNKLTRVVTPLDSGEVKSPNHPDPFNRVWYIIFSMADNDLRGQYLQGEAISWRELFKSLHHVAIGIRQLHGIGIAHQDIKPSNILCYQDKGSKISDLGRVTNVSGTSPFSNIEYTGDRSYAPLEAWFPGMIREFSDRKLSDVFMFGSLVFHTIMGVQISACILEEVKLIHPRINSLSFAEGLPFYKSAFVTILNRFSERCNELFDQRIADELTSIVKELCEPDPDTRGNIKKLSKGARLSMDRYVGKMNMVHQNACVLGMK